MAFVTTQDKTEPLVIRSAAILTNAYVAGNTIGPTASMVTSGGVSPTITNFKPSDYRSLTLLVDFTIGSLTDAQIKVECQNSPDTAFYQLTSEAVAAGVSTVSPKVFKLAATGKYYITIDPIKADTIKISAIGTGTVTDSSLAINAIMSNI
jgi:hypothetical protein